ncbi:MAG: single-stranded DNA-binding protein [Nocardioides sp.]
MNQVHVVLQGYVGTRPTLRKAGEVEVANFRLASTPSRFDRVSGEWVNEETQWYTVSCWRRLASNVADSLRKGDPVVVSGRLTHVKYVNKDGVISVSEEIEAEAIGPDLSRCRTHLMAGRVDAEAPAETDRAALDRLVDQTDGAVDGDRNAELVGS